MAVAFTGLAEFSVLSASITNSETTVAHGGTVTPDFVIATAVNAAQHNVNRTKAADATNVYLIADATVTASILCIWVSGAKKTS